MIRTLWYFDQSRAGHRRRQADRVHEPWCDIAEHVDERAPAGDITSARRQCLAERSHPNVYGFRVDAAMLRAAPASRTENTETMGIVDHEPGAEPLLQLNQMCQVSSHGGYFPRLLSPCVGKCAPRRRRGAFREPRCCAGDMVATVKLWHKVFDRGINPSLIIYPGVPLKGGRLRFFLTSEHSQDQIRLAISATTACLRGERVNESGRAIASM
jgi:hypothetical protein